jgi:hypothetical protein
VTTSRFAEHPKTLITHRTWAGRVADDNADNANGPRPVTPDIRVIATGGDAAGARNCEGASFAEAEPPPAQLGAVKALPREWAEGSCLPSDEGDSTATPVSVLSSVSSWRSGDSL